MSTDTLAHNFDTSIGGHDPVTGEPDEFRMQPHNIEAEQALLGALLINNEVYHRVSDFLSANDFFEPVHQQIYSSAAQRIQQGQLANPVTLKTMFEEEPALKEVGGVRYLGRLAQAAEKIINAMQYARLVHDLSVRRQLIQIGEDVVNGGFDRNNELDGKEQIEAAEKQLFDLAELGEAKGDFAEFSNVLTKAVEMIDDAHKKTGQVTGVPTGIKAMDAKLGGMQPSDLTIIAARPSMGKSALAVTMAANAAAIKAAGADAKDLKNPNYTVGLFSLEMSSEQLAMRLLSAEAQISSEDLRRGQLRDDSEFQRVVDASQRLSIRPLFIDDTPALSVSALRTRARRLKRVHGLSMIVVDYLQLVRGVSTVGSNANRTQEVSEVTWGLKALAKELDVPVIALSQLSRAVESREDKRPQLSDLRESGSIEQDADIVMFIYREDYYLSRAEPQQREGEGPDKYRERFENWRNRMEEVHNQADIIIAKQRNGPIGTVRLQFDPSYGRFRDPEFVNYHD